MSIHNCRLLLANLLVSVACVSTLPADELVSKKLSVAGAIDHYIDARLNQESVKSAPTATDATLVRRLMLDLAGRIPTANEARAYVDSSDPQKRQELIRKLIASPDFVRHSAAEFEFLLKGYSQPAPSVHEYLLTAFQENRSWDRMFQDLMGETPDRQPAGNFVLGRLEDHDALVRDVSSIFLGMNIECARCHDHPHVDGISQEYYFGTRSFFGRCFNFQGQLHERQYGVVQFRPLDGEERAARLIFLTGQVVDEIIPSAEEQKQKIDAENKRIDELNKAFKEKKEFPTRPAFSRKASFVEAALAPEARERMAASIVNRLWNRFFGRGLVMPVDQMHAQNPASHSELLAWLTRDLIDHEFDLRHTTQGLVSSRAYARSSRWPGESPPAAVLFAVSSARPLSPLQYGRSLQLVGELPDWTAEQTREQRAQQLEAGARQQYEKHLPSLKPGDQVGITEVLKFSNDQDLLNALGRNLVTALENVAARDEQIATASWSIYSRPPSEEEVSLITELLDEQLRDDPESVTLARQKRAVILAARSRVAAIEQEIQQLELPARQQAQRKVLERTADYLAVVSESRLPLGERSASFAERKATLNQEILTRWQQLTAANAAAVSKMDLLTGKMNSINGNKQLLGWGSDATPWLGLNPLDEPANAGFVVPSRSLAVHPSPEKRIAIGWQSPFNGRVRVSLRVSDGHPGGGNGVDWAIVHRQAIDERRVKEGYVKQGGSFPDGNGLAVAGELDVRTGEFVSLVITAHDHQHSCDTTICDLTITEVEESRRTWNAAEQLQNRIHLNNPLADIAENRAVWHFYTVNDSAGPSTAPIVAHSSLLGKWINLLHAGSNPKELETHASAIQELLLQESGSANDVNNRLREDFRSPAGPLFSGVNLHVSHDKQIKAAIAERQAERNTLHPIAAQPLPPLPPGSDERHRKALRQVIWAMLMSPEFRFNH